MIWSNSVFDILFLCVLHFSENEELKFSWIVGSGFGYHILTWIYDRVLPSMKYYLQKKSFASPIFIRNLLLTFVLQQKKGTACVFILLKISEGTTKIIHNETFKDKNRSIAMQMSFGLVVFILGFFCRSSSLLLGTSRQVKHLQKIREWDFFNAYTQFFLFTILN